MYTNGFRLVHGRKTTLTPATTTPATAVLYTTKGKADVIATGQRDVRATAAGEVRIRVTAAAINPTDILLRDPSLRSAAPWVRRRSWSAS